MLQLDSKPGLVVDVPWGTVAVNDRIIDGDNEELVTGLHAIQESIDGFDLSVKRSMKDSLTVSGDHLIKVKIPAITGGKGLQLGKTYNIPPELGTLLTNTKTYAACNYHVKSDVEMTEDELWHRIQVGPPLENVEVEYLDEEDPLEPGLYWVPAWAIHYYGKLGVKFQSDLGKRIHTSYSGLIDARCVTTESGTYRMNGLMSHNSVAIRNVFFHIIQHGENIKVAGIDLKLTEFTPWKGHKNVVGIANDIPTALEILRLGREIMYSRNKQLADLGLVNFTDFKPRERDGWEMISGMKFKSRDMLEVEVNGTVTKMPAAEAVDLILEQDE